jgi:CPA2 family monovalent cation:H+ antiporter-2
MTWLRRRRRYVPEDAVANLVGKDPGKRHAVLVGYGRVGSAIARALERRGFGYILVDQDRRLVERLRARGVTVIYGDAIDADLLERARLPDAAVLVIAVSDPAVGAIVLERARELAPQLPVVVRTHAEGLASRLRGQRKVWPVVGERELAIQMARLTLRRFGVSGIEAEAITQGLRASPPDDPGDGERRSGLFGLPGLGSRLGSRVPWRGVARRPAATPEGRADTPAGHDPARPGGTDEPTLTPPHAHAVPEAD